MKKLVKAKTMNFRMPASLWKKFRIKCMKLDMGCAEKMRMLISEFVNGGKDE